MADTSPFSPPMVLSREQWGMPGPVGPKCALPFATIFLHHTVTSVTRDPVADARLVAEFGIARFGRMSYSALVHPARVIFWAEMEHEGAHTLAWNSKAFGLSLVGNYEDDACPDSLAYDACVALHHLRAFGLVTATPEVRPHRDVKATACPGQHAVAKVLPELRAVAARPDWRP